MFNPNQSIVQLKIFRVAIFILLFTASVSAVFIVKHSHLELSLNYKGFNHFFSVFKFPLAILAMIIPTVALIATNHRSEQTREQIRLTNSQNNFTNYYKHLEEFEKFGLKATEKPDPLYYVFNFRSLHSSLFHKAKEGNYAPNVVLINEFYEHSKKMLLLLTSPKGSERDKIEAISEFMSEQEKFHAKHQISLPQWTATRSIEGKVVPDSMGEIFSSLILLLSELRELAQFDTSYETTIELLHLIHLDISRFQNLSTYDLSSEDFNSLYTEVSTT
ncbi:hypothetical protein CWO01_11660 [Vibrio splendidus]|uniref:hypothetical protein n=1 Tax=Vibrio splendidus TaxID=29497 RepID=UPI000D3B2056|nr:hypothetical protein [Vibrio splendidus]PTP62419.1 hypothetical protein CWO01_11660 [Vibrio splendidus]